MASKLPTTFRKLVVNRPSSKFREVVSIETVPTPQPGDGEVLVKNKYAGINASDINYSAAKYNPDVKFPIDPGFEAVAEVVATGPNCTLKIGQIVMYLDYGAFSEYKLTKAARAIPLPDMKAEYLPLLLSGNTAVISLDKLGDLKAGETVLITAAAGGTGQIAVQWAKLAGCHVIGTCSTDEKVKFLKDIGCDRPINYKKESIADVLKKEYPKGLDVVYETIGGEVFDTCIENLAVRGRLIVIGFITNYGSEEGFIPSKTLANLPQRLLTKSQSVRGFLLNHYQQDWGPYVMKQLKHFKDGKLKTFVDKGENSAAGPFIGLEKVVDAVDYLYSQKSIGKIIVEL